MPFESLGVVSYSPYIVTIAVSVAVCEITQQEPANLHLSSPYSSTGKKIITFKANQLWNELPVQLKTIKSPNIFKYQFKIYLINELITK